MSWFTSRSWLRNGTAGKKSDDTLESMSNDISWSYLLVPFFFCVSCFALRGIGQGRSSELELWRLRTYGNVSCEKGMGASGGLLVVIPFVNI